MGDLNGEKATFTEWSETESYAQGSETTLRSCSMYETARAEEASDVSDSSECSDGDPQSEGEIDQNVLQEMTNLEETFHRMGLKFRLIDRIGEGVSETGAII